MNVTRLPILFVLASLLVGARSSAAPEQESKPPRTDRYGDALPPAALARLGTVRLRHGGAVCSLAFSPDGKTLASGSWDGTARLWDRTTGKELRRFRGHASGVNAVAFSPDGKLLATSGRYNFKDEGDHSVRVWDFSSGRLIRVLEREDENSNIAGHYLAFSPDGKLLAGGSDRTILVWEVSTGKESSRIRFGGRIYGVVLGPDGTFLALGTESKAAVIWDARSGKRLRHFEGHRESPGFAAVCSLVLSPNGKILATAGEDRDRTIRLWNRETGEQLRKLTYDSYKARVLMFSPDGKTLVSGDWSDSQLCLWDVSSGKLRQKLEQVEGTLAIAFTSDGKTMATGTYDQTIRLWDTSNGRQHYQGGHEGEILALAFGPDKKHLASVGRDGTLRRWEMENGKEVRRARVGSTGLVGACLSANGGRLATRDAKEKKWLCLWDVAAGVARRRLANVPEHMFAFALSPDGRTLLASDWGVDLGRRLFLWDVIRDENAMPLVRQILSQEEKDANIESIVFSADSKWAAVGVDGSVVRLVNLAAFKAPAPRAKGDELAQPIDEFWLSSLALSADGSALALGMSYLSLGAFTNPHQPALSVCDTAHPGRKRAFGRLKRGESVDAVAFSPDGKTLAAARDDGTILLWDTATAKVRRTLPGHQGSVKRLVFSRDGSVLASGGADATILIWDMQR